MQTTTKSPARPVDTAPTLPRAPWLRLFPEDGWLTLFLLLIMVFTTIASIQDVTPVWAPGLDILTPAAGVGLLLGYLSVQQGRLPSGLVQLVAIVLGVLFSFQATANEVLGGDRGALWSHSKIWFQKTVLEHQSSNDNAVFLLFLAILSFLLAYISVWLVIHTRRPWLAAIANCVVLLINLNAAPDDRSLFFSILFLVATLLLLVRFTLAENMRMWRAKGLRFSPDLSWDFMQAGAIFVVTVLLLAYLLPANAANGAISDWWNSPANPWQTVETRVAAMFNGAGGAGPGTINFFGTSLQLTGKVTLPDVPVLRYTLPKATDDPSQYLMTESFGTYNGQGQWTSSQSSTLAYAPHALQPSSTSTRHIDTYHIIIAHSMDGNHLFAPGDEAAAFSVPSQAQQNNAQMNTAWLSDSPVAAGDAYDAQGYVSTATTDQLDAVAYPSQLSSSDLANAYPDVVLQEYLYGPSQAPIASDVSQTARQVTQGAPSMYAAAQKLEDYLRNNFRYSLDNPTPAPGTDYVSFFLQTKQGFCTHFATAMAIMGRSLGMPTRVALGFTQGSYDAKTNSYVVKGTAAHVWTQIYFAQYGWVNFEPTASFAKFGRAIGSGGSTTPVAGSTTPGANGRPTPNGARDAGGFNGGSTSTTKGQTNALVNVGLGLSLLIALTLLSVVLAMFWWRLLYKGLTPVTLAFARVARLGTWAGAAPRNWQTPTEYAEQLGDVIPAQRTSLRQLSDLYAHERWGGGAVEGDESQHLYDKVRVAISRVIVSRLREAPSNLLARGRRRLRRRRHRA